MDKAGAGVSIDAGANEGGYTAKMLEKGLTVHAFEPVPEVFAGLAKRYAAEPRVWCNQLGLSDYPLTLHGLTIKCAWTLTKPEDENFGECAMFKGKTFSVKFTTIDEYLSGARLNVLKLDVDGYEHKVLAGGSRTLQTFKPPILCEFSAYIPKISGSVQAFVDTIFALGYVIVPCDGSAIFETWEQVKPHYPYNTSFDVMLIHREKLPAFKSDFGL